MLNFSSSLLSRGGGLSPPGLPLATPLFRSYGVLTPKICASHWLMHRQLQHCTNYRATLCKWTSTQKKNRF